MFKNGFSLPIGLGKSVGVERSARKLSTKSKTEAVDSPPEQPSVQPPASESPRTVKKIAIGRYGFGQRAKVSPRPKRTGFAAKHGKLGVRLPDFERRPETDALREQSKRLYTSTRKHSWTDRLKPYSDPLRTLGEALNQWNLVSKKTDDETDQHKVDPSSVAPVLYRINREVIYLDKAIEACQEVLAPQPWFLPKMPPKLRAELRLLACRLVAQREALLASKAQLEQALGNKAMGSAEIRAYAEVRMPITPSTRTIAFKDKDFVEAKPLGSAKGGVHEVEFVRCRVADSSGAITEQAKVFKADPPGLEVPDGAGLIGIDARDKRLAARAVAVAKVAGALEADVIPKTEFGLKDGRFGVVMDRVEGTPLQLKGEVVLPMQDDAVLQWAQAQPDALRKLVQEQGFDDAALVDGGIAFKRSFEDFVLIGGVGQEDRPMEVQPGDIDLSPDVLLSDPAITRELVVATCVNWLTNNIDCHRGNVMVKPGGIRHADGRPGSPVRYFDNDLSFGIRSPDLRADAVHLTELPPVIPRSFHEAVLALTPDHVNSLLTGLLPAPEIEAAKRRLEVLQVHCLVLELENKVLPDDDAVWASSQVRAALKIDQVQQARGDLPRLMALQAECGKANLAASYLLDLSISEAKTQSGKPLQAKEAVSFDPVRMRQALHDRAANAAVAVA
jgi:hypothetical protein